MSYMEYKNRNIKYCDNSHDKGRPILGCGCFKKKAVKTLEINYGHNSDVLQLCKDCCSSIKKDARKHGYKTITKAI